MGLSSGVESLSNMALSMPWPAFASGFIHYMYEDPGAWLLATLSALGVASADRLLLSGLRADARGLLQRILLVQLVSWCGFGGCQDSCRLRLRDATHATASLAEALRGLRSTLAIRAKDLQGPAHRCG